MVATGLFCSSASSTPRGRRSTVPDHLGRTRVVSAKLRQSDARWRASIQACYTLLRPVLQSRQPSLTRASKPRILEATRQHIMELERALAMLLEMKNNVIQTLFDGPPAPRLTVEQYKTLFRGLYPLDAPIAESWCRGAGGCLCSARLPAASDGPPAASSQDTAASDPPSSASGTSEPPTEPDLAELASLLHDAYDATDGQMTEVTPVGPLAGGDGNIAAPTPLEEAAMMGARGDAEPGPDMPMLVKTEDEAESAETAGGDAESLPDVEENLSLELPSLELSGGWGDCEEETSAPRVAWQELERAAHSLSVPAQLEQFTKIQRSDWDLDNDMPSDSAPPESHLSPFSPEMALPAFCSTPDAGDGAGAPMTLVTPPPGAGRAKRAGSAAAAAGRRAADRCRRALTLSGGR